MTIVEQGTLGDLPYAIISTGMGTLCGYLGVPPSHPWYGQDYDDLDAEVHGGLYPSFYQHQLDVEIEKQGIPRNYPIETELDLWWFGFDCAHYQDLVPGMEKYAGEGATYKDRDFVYKELEGLATQAYDAARAAAHA